MNSLLRAESKSPSSNHTNMIKHNTPRSEYDSIIGRLNYSRFKHFLDTPAHLKAYDEAEKEDSAALVFGDALHTLVLEGKDVFDDKFSILPAGTDRRTKEGKATYELIKSLGKTIISEDDRETITKMYNSLKEHPLYFTFFDSNGNNEVTLCTEFQGVEVKCRFDRVMVMNGAHYIIDIKSVGEVPRSRNFRSSVFTYRYHIQQEFYRGAYEAETGVSPKFIFVAMEKKAPHSVRFFSLDDEFSFMAQKEVSDGLKLYKACLKDDFWPAFPPVVSTIKYRFD